MIFEILLSFMIGYVLLSAVLLAVVASFFEF